MPYEMRSPRSAGTESRADRRPDFNNANIHHDELTNKQASRIARLCLVSLSTAATIAWLAYGVAR
jgi:hypothetical protein